MISFNSGSIELYKSFFSNLFSVIVVEFRGTFCQKQAVSKKKKRKVWLCYFENVEMVYFDISEVPPPPCAFQMKVFLRRRLILSVCSVPLGFHI